MMRDRPFELAFENVRVPVANRIGEEGQGFAFGQSWLTEGPHPARRARDRRDRTVSRTRDRAPHDALDVRRAARGASGDAVDARRHVRAAQSTRLMVYTTALAVRSRRGRAVRCLPVQVFRRRIVVCRGRSLHADVRRPRAHDRYADRSVLARSAQHDHHRRSDRSAQDGTRARTSSSSTHPKEKAPAHG